MTHFRLYMAWLPTISIISVSVSVDFTGRIDNSIFFVGINNPSSLKELDFPIKEPDYTCIHRADKAVARVFVQCATFICPEWFGRKHRIQSDNGWFGLKRNGIHVGDLCFQGNGKHLNGPCSFGFPVNVQGINWMTDWVSAWLSNQLYWGRKRWYNAKTYATDRNRAMS